MRVFQFWLSLLIHLNKCYKRVIVQTQKQFFFSLLKSIISENMYSMKPVDLGAYVSRVLGLWLLLFKILPNLNQNEISQNPTWPGCGWLIFVQRHRKPIELSNQVQLGPQFILQVQQFTIPRSLLCFLLLWDELLPQPEK